MVLHLPILDKAGEHSMYGQGVELEKPCVGALTWHS